MWYEDAKYVRNEVYIYTMKFSAVTYGKSVSACMLLSSISEELSYACTERYSDASEVYEECEECALHELSQS